MEALEEMFHYHAWATEQVIDFLGGQPAERLDAKVAGTYGTVLDTLVHMLAADQRYLDRMSPRDESVRVREGMRPSTDDLKRAVASSRRRWQELLPHAGEIEVEIPPRGDEPGFHHAANLLLAQAIHHGNDHRTQVCTTLGAAGVQPPDIDVWSHWVADHP